MNSTHELRRPTPPWCWARPQYGQRRHVITRESWNTARTPARLTNRVTGRFTISLCGNWYAFPDQPFPPTDYQGTAPFLWGWRAQDNPDGHCQKCEQRLRAARRRGQLT